MRAEELKGHLDAVLLAALEGGPRHGYAVIEALRQSTGRPAGPADRDDLPGAAAAGAGRADRRNLVGGRRPAAGASTG